LEARDGFPELQEGYMRFLKIGTAGTEPFAYLKTLFIVLKASENVHQNNNRSLTQTKGPGFFQ